MLDLRALGSILPSATSMRSQPERSLDSSEVCPVSRPWLIAFVCVALCALLAGPSSAQTIGAVVGEVVDDATGTPIPHIQVYVVGVDVGAVTDERGRFRIPEAPTGSRVIRAEGLGYSASEASVTVVAGGTAEVTMALHP